MGILFEDARENSKIRQRFLEEINIEKYSPFVKDIIYFECKRGDRIMETVFDPASYWLSNTTSTIRVSDYAFRAYSWNEFCNILIPHEGLHALQNYFESTEPEGKFMGINFQNGEKLIYSEKEIRQEIETHRNQIQHPTFAKCSPKFKKRAHDWLKLYENFLTMQTKNSNNRRDNIFKE